MDKKLCKVVVEDITTEEIAKITREQRNIISSNNRVGESSAFSKALSGSKVFLEAQGYIKESEE